MKYMKNSLTTRVPFQSYDYIHKINTFVCVLRKPGIYIYLNQDKAQAPKGDQAGLL